jgi:hemerythrin
MIDEGFVTWNSSFSVLHAELDAEHRKIMSTLNRLHCLEREGADGYEAQHAVHQALIQRTRELTTDFSFHDTARFRRNILRLNQWWVGHIQTMDHKYIHAMSHSR